MDRLTTQAFLDAELADWRKLAQALHARFVTESWGGRRAGGGAGGRGDGTTNVFPGVTERDVVVARRISSVAQSLGLAADPSAVVQFELALDTADLAAVGPFWAAVLTGSTESLKTGDVFDPTARVPNMWFQGTDAHETPRQRFHVDLWVGHDVAEERIAAGVAAGGRVVYDEEAPEFTVLADPEGNKVCICTCLGR
jgi:4a-hydroxytetrahydrobiopterin dehydratase